MADQSSPLGKWKKARFSPALRSATNYESSNHGKCRFGIARGFVAFQLSCPLQWFKFCVASVTIAKLSDGNDCGSSPSYETTSG